MAESYCEVVPGQWTIEAQPDPGEHANGSPQQDFDGNSSEPKKNREQK